MTWHNAREEIPAGTDPGTAPVTDPVMVLWRDGAMTTPPHTHPRDPDARGVVQLGLFESEQPGPCLFVHPRHRRFAGLVLRAPADEDAALEVLALLEPELGVLIGRLVRRGVEPAEARCDARSVAWEVVAGHRVGPVLPTKVNLASAIWTELRRELGLRRQRRIEVVPLTDEIDVPAPAAEPSDGGPGLLDSAVRAGVITEHQARVVAQTRIEGRELAEVAHDLGRPYGAVQKERRRTEVALSAFARSYAEGPR